MSTTPTPFSPEIILAKLAAVRCSRIAGEALAGDPLRAILWMREGLIGPVAELIRHLGASAGEEDDLFLVVGTVAGWLDVLMASLQVGPRVSASAGHASASREIVSATPDVRARFGPLDALRDVLTAWANSGTPPSASEFGELLAGLAGTFTASALKLRVVGGREPAPRAALPWQGPPQSPPAGLAEGVALSRV